LTDSVRASRAAARREQSRGRNSSLRASPHRFEPALEIESFLQPDLFLAKPGTQLLLLMDSIDLQVPVVNKQHRLTWRAANERWTEPNDEPDDALVSSLARADRLLDARKGANRRSRAAGSFSDAGYLLSP
jgi:hypothetical protein